MKILVAGGAGYIGSMLVPALKEKNYEVDVADFLWFGNYLPKDTRIINKNLFDLDQKEFKGYDQVIFVAGLSNDPMAEHSPKQNFIYNGALPSYLAFQSKKMGVKRFIYACSCSIYGYTLNKSFDEESPVTCDYPYGLSKFEGEKVPLLLQDDDFSVITLRKGTVGGFSPRMRTDLVVNAMFKSSILEKKVTVNNPVIWRPVLDIRDCVNAYLKAVEADPSVNGPFNIASGNYTIGEIGDIVREKVERKTGEKIYLETKDIPDFRNYKVSIEKAKTFLKFNPKYTVQETVDHLFENLEEIGDLGNERYSNIKVFEKFGKRSRLIHL